MRSFAACFVLLLGMINVSFAQKRSTTQGIQGVVLWKAGDQMPSPDRPKQSASGSGVKRDVYVYTLTTDAQTTKTADGFYQKIRTKLVKKFTTDAQGRFKIKLPVGKYSLFTKEEKGLYANLYDGNMNIYPIEVKRGKYTEVTFEISFMAAF